MEPIEQEDDGLAGDDSTERIIRISGDISQDIAEKVVLSIHRAVETPGEITIVIASEGGSIDDGMRIIDALDIAKTRQCPIHTVVQGKAYSMAAYIACMGDTRTIYPHARMLFHAGRYDLEEDGVTAAQLKILYEEMMVADRTFERILFGVGVPAANVAEMLSKDVYIGADEAISLGIMQSIETEII